MIDFNNLPVFKLSRAKGDDVEAKITPLLIEGENIISAYKAIRDFVVFTDKRVISVNVQGSPARSSALTR